MDSLPLAPPGKPLYLVSVYKKILNSEVFVQHFLANINELTVKEVCSQGKAGAIVISSLQRKRETVADHFSSEC